MYSRVHTCISFINRSYAIDANKLCVIQVSVCDVTSGKVRLFFFFL